MKSNTNKNKNLFISFCMLVTLPIVLMCLFGYLLSLLNGQTIESPALQSELTTMIGVGGLALLYWFVMGVRSFSKHYNMVKENKAQATKTVALPVAVKGLIERKKISFPAAKWLKGLVKTMLILSLTALVGMILTNPSYEEFKAFTPERNTSLHYAEWRKVHNYMLWSVYQKDVFEREDREDDFKLVGSQQYQGMLLNFTPL